MAAVWANIKLFVNCIWQAIKCTVSLGKHRAFGILIQHNRHAAIHYTSLFVLLVCYWRESPQWASASSFTRFLDHTQWRTTAGRTPLDEWSARRRDLYLTTHNTYKRRPCPVGFEPTTPEGKRLPGPAYFLVLVVNDLMSGNQWSMLSNSDLMPANLSATAQAFPSHNPYAKWVSVYS
jgi:hypothetical protein